MANEIIELKFDKGLNSQATAFYCPPGHCLTFSDYMQNYGILIPRPSLTAVDTGTTFGNIAGIFSWADPSQAGITFQGNIYAVDGTKAYRSSAYTTPGNTVTFTDITNAIAQPGNPISFDSLNGILVYTGNPSRVIQITSKTANCASLTVPNTFGCVKTVNNFMFGSANWLGAGGNISRVNWSNIGDPTTWGSSNFVDFRLNDGDFCTALGDLNGNCLIFKQKSIGQLQTTTLSISGAVTLGPLTTLFTQMGAPYGQQSVDNLPDGRVIFLGYDLNVYVTDGTSLTQLTKYPPPGVFVQDVISQAQLGVNGAMLKYDEMRNEIILGLNTSFPKILAYDMLQNYWRVITGITPLSINVAKNLSTKTSSLLVAAGSHIWDLTTSTTYVPTDTNGATVTPSLSTSVIFPPNWLDRSYIFLTIIYSASSSVNYQYGFDGTYGSTQTLSASNNRADIKILMTALSTSVQATSFQLKFLDTGGASIYKCFLSMEGTT